MKVLITDHGFPHVNLEESIIKKAGFEVCISHCKTEDDLISATNNMHGLIVQWAPITKRVIESLNACQCIVRYGIGVDNIDLVAAKSKGITVCNVPDYGINEVAEHTVSLALALQRQLPMIDRRIKNGIWKITPDSPIIPLDNSVYATAGFGRIAKAVHRMMSGFGVKSIAYDPFVSKEDMAALNVEKVDIEELFKRADLLSLHLPLTAQTKHFVGSLQLKQMKPTALLINTARGGLIDTKALALNLDQKTIASAGLDVYELEPLEKDHPIKNCGNALLTSHVAWYSEASIPRLQRLAAEEIVRALSGYPVKNPVTI